MILEGRSIFDGIAEGEVVKFNKPVVILGDVDEKGGTILRRDVRGKIVVFPRGAGSTVGSYTLYGLRYYGNSPAAFVLEEAETIVAVGVIMAEIPTVDKILIDKIRDGQRIRVEGNKVIL